MAKKKITKKRAKRPTAADRKTPPASGHEKLAELEKYGLFMALPRKERKEIFGYDTDIAFAKENKLARTTLSEWKWKPKLWEFRDKYLVHFKKRTAGIINKLADRAERTGEAFHTLTYMKLVEGYSEKSGVDITSKGQTISGFRIILNDGSTRPNNSSKKDK